MSAVQARKITLAPLTRIAPDGIERAAIALAEAPPKFPVRIGARVSVGGVDLVAIDVDPLGASRVEDQTEMRLAPAPFVKIVPKAPWCLAVLLDHTSAMAPFLERARGGARSLLHASVGVVETAGVVAFAEAPFILRPLRQLYETQAAGMGGLGAKGDADLSDALDVALGEVLHAPPHEGRAIVIVTHGKLPQGPTARRAAPRTTASAPPAEHAGILDAARRAQRLGITVHAWTIGGEPRLDLVEATKMAGGIAVHEGDGTLRPILDALEARAATPPSVVVPAATAAVRPPAPRAKSPPAPAPAPAAPSPAFDQVDLVVRVLPPTAPRPTPRTWKPKERQGT
ncbi:MAG: vWA domain-containing protein [Thermoplasmatota archaeon]